MYDIRQIRTRKEKEEQARLLASVGLEREEADCMIGLFDEDDELAACGSAAGNIIKNLAVRPELAGEGLVSKIATELVLRIKASGQPSVFVFTKPANSRIFQSLGFHNLASTDKAALFEDRKGGMDKFLASLPKADGALVVNANPFTKGHLWLAGQASAKSERLLLLLVEEDASFFSTEERLDMARGSIEESGLKNVVLAKGGPYIISKKTFPTYFLKQADDKNLAYCKLDATLFATRIAPGLGIVRRFAGEEPLDPATAQYNAVLGGVLPQHGIAFAASPRAKAGGEVISASRVRALFKSGDFCGIQLLVPPFSHRYLLALKLADLACESLLKEAWTTPKPGLVDRANNGSHRDMDLRLFEKSAEALRPCLKKIATWAVVRNIAEMKTGLPNDIRKLGIEAESAMRKATGGINTHKGAIFSLGSVLYSASVAIQSGLELSPENVLSLCKICFKGLTGQLADGQDPSHGKTVFQRYKVGGAREEAQAGFPSVLGGLGFLNSLPAKMDENQRLAWTGVYLISILKDSNIYYRSDARTALWARENARRTLGRIGSGLGPVRELDEKFVAKNISPGGAADMLALVCFFDLVSRLRLPPNGASKDGPSASCPSDGRPLL